MKLNLTLLLIIFTRLSLAQQFSSPKSICNQNENKGKILRLYKDLKGNEYVIWLEIPFQNNTNQTNNIRLQKYNNQDNPIYPECGIIIATTNSIDFPNGELENGGESRGVDCIVDKDENLYVFLTVHIGNDILDGGLPISNLIAYKIDKAGNHLWGNNGMLLLENQTYLLILGIQQTMNDDIHLLFSVTGTLQSNYLRIDKNGVNRFTNSIYLGYRFSYDGLFSFDLRQNSILFKNSKDEIIIANANYDFNDGTYHIYTQQVDNSGNVTTQIIDSNAGSFIQFNKIENGLYYIKQEGSNYPMYKFNDDGSASSLPIITFYDRPGIQIVKTENFYFYIGLTPSINGLDKVVVQKIDFSGNKQLGVDGYNLVNANNDVARSIRLLSDSKDGIRIIYTRQDISSDFVTALPPCVVYQYIPSSNTPLFPEGTKVFSDCSSQYPYSSIGDVLMDNKDGSLNIYLQLEYYNNKYVNSEIQIDRVFYSLARQDLYIVTSLPFCSPYLVKKTK